MGRLSSKGQKLVKEKEFILTGKIQRYKAVQEYEYSIFVRVTFTPTYKYPYTGYVEKDGGGSEIHVGREKTKREAWLRAYKYAKKRYGIE